MTVFAPSERVPETRFAAHAAGAADFSIPSARATTVFADMALILLLTLMLRLPLLSVSVAGFNDESAFALAGREVLFGHLPYLTFWDHKPPGAFYLLAAAMGLLGQSVEVVRAFGIASAAATSLLLYAIAGRVWPDRLVQLGAAALYAVNSTRMYGSATVTEIMLAPFEAAGILILLSLADRSAVGGTKVLALWASAGLAFGIAVWIKYVPAIPAALAGGYVLFIAMARARPAADGGAVDLAGAARCCLAFSLGLVLPFMAGLAVFWRAGALAQFWHANFAFAGAYILQEDYVGEQGAHGFVVRVLRGVTMAMLELKSLALAALVFLPGLRRFIAGQRRAAPLGVIVAWVLGEILAVLVQMRFYGHHFLVLVPPLAVLAVIAVRFHVGVLARPAATARATAIVLAVMIVTPAVHHGRFVATLLAREDIPRAVARLVAPYTAAGDMIYVVNHEPIIYLLSGSRLPTRYAYPETLVGPHRSLIDADPAAENLRILEGRPRFIVLNAAWREHSIPWDARAMTDVEAALARDYLLVATWTGAEAKEIIQLFERGH